MTTLRRCPVCRNTVNSSEITHCPACGAVLDRAFSDQETTTVDDIIKRGKRRIIPPDGAADAHMSGSGSAGGRDIAEVLSGDAFQSILNENRGTDKSFSSGENQAVTGAHVGQEEPSDRAYSDQSATRPDDARKERVAPFSTLLGSRRQSASPSREETDPQDMSAGVSDVEADEDRPFIERPEPVRPPSFKKSEPKPRTWWGATRQTLWLLLVLLLCIVFFRIFGPTRKKQTIEDFFQPGNPDIEFLDAIEFFEKYYEKKRTKPSDNEQVSTDETSVGSMQLPQPADKIHEDNPGQAPERTPSGNPLPPASRRLMP